MKTIATRIAEKRGARQAVKNYDKATKMTPAKRVAVDKIRAEYKASGKLA